MGKRTPFRFKGAPPQPKKQEISREDAINILTQERIQLHPFFLPSSPMPLHITTVAHGSQTRDARGLTKIESVALHIFAQNYPKGHFGVADSTIESHIRQAFNAAQVFLQFSEQFKSEIIMQTQHEVTQRVDSDLAAARERQSKAPAVTMKSVPDEVDAEQADEPEEVD